MPAVGQKERLTQNRVVTLFQKQLGYEYLGNWEDRENNINIEEDILRKYLTERGYSQTLIGKAIYELTKAATNQSKSLYDINKDVYTLLRYGVKVKEDVGENTRTVWLIDWKYPDKNHFAIAEEVTVRGENKKRPDVVLYVNGIALGVLELKRSTISVSEGVRQNIDNQKQVFIRPFFATIQLVMAGNDTEGIRYGAIGTHEKYYLAWKEESGIENTLDRHIIQLCQKDRFLEMLHDFIVYDRGIKKLCRHNQYFAVKASQESLRRREGGIIWHAQGSGKSLVMVWLTKWIRENIKDARVLIITDRDELDKQIEKVFKGVSEDIYRTKSGSDLIEKLNSTTPWLLCSLIHKFGNKEEADYDAYIEDLKKSLPGDFRAKGDIYVFVDECHRTQSGKLHEAMKKILPNALLIGFTGTPLLKKDKKKSLEVFGKYIHTYKFDEAVADKVVLDLRYEARNVDQNITSQARIDEWFEAKTRGLTDFAKTELKKKWGTMKRVLSSRSRLDKIVADILLDMATKDRLQNGRGNAMLVSGSIYEACKYYELFQNAGLKNCAIVTSYTPTTSDLKGESTGEDSPTDKLKKYEVYQKMLDGKDPETFEDEVKKKFVDEPARMKLLVVVDKLLTGFDAPSATYLYIDKSMQDHGLFQAICRVNRLDGEDKEYGYIIDYKDLFKSLEKSVDDYTSGAFDAYDREDVGGLLSNRLKEAREHLDNALESIKALCEPVAPPKDSLAYRRYFCGNTENKDELKENEPKRIALYKHTSALVRAYASIASEMEKAGYTPEETEHIKNDVKYYENVRAEVKLASGDYIDLKAYEPAMRHLIDTYISANESEKISAFDDMTLIELIVKRGVDAVAALPEGINRNKEAVAETIENNMRKLIIDEMPTNPKYYEKMSALLDELIKERKEEARSYEEYLARIIELSKKAKNPASSATYPKTLNSNAKRALYDNLCQDEELTMALDAEICHTKKDGWRGNIIKEREVKYAIRKHVKDDAEVERVFELVKNQSEY
ncbi:type I site-specific deoxyribonuclease, HsdR family [Candidatus Methanoperedens nitroreducens]|uniref:type I site-specific deoxyribonuclease n=1 Tax=Candidatus Methanoperedens nitratireducens TaxID=1392998 RepID=A0A062VBV9_9EURY|nr:HsdR family type I site-specific deoxyribonuclease [Candidatus Methanoperedens nitroreducens]KCZ72790.1 type I site-specific deoxyribonuclease, HsdR family [Candidatus Methanoperedens nitroreducens]MCZ7622476.1 HsdR family type I site-specific deoxyribonuclease [Candidatus Kuenenia sp.]MDJ1423281.1 HsdR family type I site-specific deoxyribonuclease [Candidatus Methanoperedens sp.]